jgi:hypothetical protein
MSPNVLAALHARERQLLTVMTLRQDLDDRRARLAAAQLTPASQAKKVRVAAAGVVLLLLVVEERLGLLAGAAGPPSHAPRQPTLVTPHPPTHPPTAHTQPPQVDTLRSQVGQLEAAGAAAEAEYSRQLARNREELQALRASRGAELTAALAAAVSVQLQQCQAEAALWTRLANSL